MWGGKKLNDERCIYVAAISCKRGLLRHLGSKEIGTGTCKRKENSQVNVFQFKSGPLRNSDERSNFFISVKKPSAIKVPLGPEFWYSKFLHFRTQFVVLSHHAKFHLITTTRSRFFRTVFVEILRPPLLALVPEAGLRMSGSDVRGSPQA